MSNDNLTTGMEIDWETADRITVLNLKNIENILAENIQRLEKLMSSQELTNTQQEDYMDDISFIKAIRKTLGYFGEV